ncbi:MAG: hypothetical protein SWX82_08605 [Cyanobacteriota bacterium]|nr:hypothetical protein [Cyanobacteriota bacterium]
MKYKTLSVGITMPSSVNFSNVRLDLSVELDDGDDVQECTANLKKEVAKLVSGSEVEFDQKALDILFYPSNEEMKKKLIDECKILEFQINSLKEKFSSYTHELNELNGYEKYLVEEEQIMCAEATKEEDDINPF